MNILNKLEEWKKKEFISPVEVEFVRFLQQMHPNESEQVLLAAAACIYAQSNGNVCLDIGKLEHGYLFNEPGTGIKITDELRSRWISALQKSELVSSGEELQPLVLEEERLYLHRFWKYEEELSGWMKAKSAEVHEISDEAAKALKSLLKPSGDLFEPNWQHLAVVLSFLKDLVIISGGPGTGKTYTVLNIIAAQKLAHIDDKFSIALAAPTGKAARRLIDSIEAGKANLPEQVKSQIEIPDEALTVHKLLGADFRGSSFKFNEQNKLPYDMVVIDEASMLDIMMWVRLIRAIGPKTKLVVLGDKDQLASVEAGSILGDICGGENSYSKTVEQSAGKLLGVTIPVSDSKVSINDCVVFLTKSYRFGEGSGIHIFSQAVNNSDADKAIKVLNVPEYPDIEWAEPSAKNISRILKEYVTDHYEYYSQKPKKERLSSSNKKKILCALRKGPFGVEQINKESEKLLKRKNQILKNEEWYSGRIVMATRNDAVLKIRNGEIGICKQGDDPKVSFEGDHAYSVSAARLKDYETAYAITIHKSQGSEFDDIAVLLTNKVNSILSKEILYTSVTRARKNTLIIASEQILRHTINHSVSRNSGVREKIWGN